MKRVFCAAALAVLSAGGAAAQSIEVTPPPSVELPAGTQASTLLPALIEHSRYSARVENGRLVGEGSEFLRALGARSQFVLLGEEHGNAGIAAFATAYWRDLSAVGYDYLAIEVDPWTSRALERELRAGGVDAWARFLAPRGGFGAPFVNWTPEAELSAAAVQSSRARRTPTIWGLDQSFIGAITWQLEDIAQGAHSADARQRAAALAEASRASPDWIGRSEVEPLQALRGALGGRRDADYAALVDAFIVSQRIYRPFVNGEGEAWLANGEREELMKRHFLEHYRAAERADGRAPRVMLKFGSYHMYRGATPTHVQGLGGFVSELAVQERSQALTINVVCGPGGSLAALRGPPTACDGDFAETLGFLTPYVDPNALTIFDLRVWKLRPRRWEHLPASTRQMIDSFDVLVIVPGGTASPLLPGVSLPAGSSR